MVAALQIKLYQQVRQGVERAAQAGLTVAQRCVGFSDLAGQAARHLAGTAAGLDDRQQQRKQQQAQYQPGPQADPNLGVVDVVGSAGAVQGQQPGLAIGCDHPLLVQRRGELVPCGLRAVAVL